MKKILFLIIGLLICHNAFALVTFTNGTVADATEVNSNFIEIDNKFSTTSGHDHDGTDSKSILLGEWQGTVVDEVYGGTGFTSYTSGDMIFATSDTGLTRLAQGAIGSIMTMGAEKKEPSWRAAGTTAQSIFSTGLGKDWVWADSVKLGNFTRDVSLASGNQTITGVGFEAQAYIFIHALSNTSMGIGVSDVTNQLGNYGHTQATTIFAFDAAGTIRSFVDGSNEYQGNLAEINADGFQITWTKTSSPTGTLKVGYIAIR